jgi:exodeoxyribonuclease VII small subunit
MARKSQSPPRSFEEGLAELERILAEIEGGQVGLEESLARYERGTFLIQHCRSVLTQAEKQIETLSRAAEASGAASEPPAAPADEADETSDDEDAT